MWFGFPLFPEQASTVAGRVDALYFFLVGVSVFFTLLIAGLILYFFVKYRRRAGNEQGTPVSGGLALEITWIVIPSLISLIMFAWGASVFFSLVRAPQDALEIQVVGKQWMWKFQHIAGQREINELHVPVGRAVKLTMTSQDVIHSFFVPAFRVKADVLPGRYTSVWFEATKPGRYHIFCAEYCGTQHSGMIGQVVVLDPPRYQAWLSGGAPQQSLAVAGEQLFQELACHTCHGAQASSRGPSLAGVFGKSVQLQSGQTVVADENYLRESVLNPQAQVVVGFEPIMPTFAGLVSEEQLLQLIAYLKSLQTQPVPTISIGSPVKEQGSVEEPSSSATVPINTESPGVKQVQPAE